MEIIKIGRSTKKALRLLAEKPRLRGHFVMGLSDYLIENELAYFLKDKIIITQYGLTVLSAREAMALK